MTVKTKSGKECPNTTIHKLHWPYRCCGEDCDKCHGIGKVFAPGDALTKKQAEAFPTHKVEIRMFTNTNWKPVPRYLRAEDINEKCYEFRLAPAPQEEKPCKLGNVGFSGPHYVTEMLANTQCDGVEVVEPAARLEQLWKGAEMTDIENKIGEAWNADGETYETPSWIEAIYSWEQREKVSIFRAGYLAARREAAAQIAEKDAEIERLKIMLADSNVCRERRAFQLTAAREREEKLADRLRLFAQAPAQEECEYEGDDYGEHRHAGYNSALAWIAKQAGNALTAYDASRAEKKEGE